MATSGNLSFRKTLLDVSEGLDKQDIRRLKYLCTDELTKTQKEGIKDGLELFEILEEKGIISENDVSYLISRMGDLGRRDLQTKLQQIVALENVPPLAAQQMYPQRTSAGDSVFPPGTSDHSSAGRHQSLSQLLPNTNRENVPPLAALQKGLKTPADFSPQLPELNQAGAASINPLEGHALQRGSLWTGR